MFTLLHRGGRHRGARPTQGPGRYSADYTRWFDERSQRWLRRLPGQDTLVFELEDINAAGWWAGLLAAVGSGSGSAYSRFVGHASSLDPRWPTYKIAGATFPRVRGLPDTLLPREAWAPGMAEALDELRHRLEAEGWCPAGRGMQPWAHRYVRPRFDWPSDGGTSTPDGQQAAPSVESARG
jgi:hypothetical protein